MSLLAADIYDFENIFENAFSLAFEDAGFENIATTSTAPLFQKVRPRLEVIFKCGSDKSPLTLLPDSGGSLRSAFFTGNTLTVGIITEAVTPGKQVHAAYRAAFRAACGLNLRSVLNGVSGRLTNHCLQWIRMTGTEYKFDPQEGYEMTAHSYDVEFSIQAPSLLQFP